VNLVAGATGIVGGEICRLLAARGVPVRALVREASDPAKVESLSALGAALVEGDVKDPSTLARACAGVDAIVSTATSTTSRGEGDTIESVDRDGQLALVDAASHGRPPIRLPLLSRDRRRFPPADREAPGRGADPYQRYGVRGTPARKRSGVLRA
jgi:uncharacterized protein YbjT (DUF2867 family)